MTHTHTGVQASRKALTHCEKRKMCGVHALCLASGKRRRLTIERNGAAHEKKRKNRATQRPKNIALPKRDGIIHSVVGKQCVGPKPISPLNSVNRGVARGNALGNYSKSLP